MSGNMLRIIGEGGRATCMSSLGQLQSLTIRTPRRLVSANSQHMPADGHAARDYGYNSIRSGCTSAQETYRRAFSGAEHTSSRVDLTVQCAMLQAEYGERRMSGY